MTRIKMTLALLVSLGMASALAQDAGKSTQSTTATTQSGAPKGDRASYRAAKRQVDDTYKAAKQKCDAVGTASIGKENCIGIARAERNLGRAQALAQYRPTERNLRDVKMAQAHRDYAHAKAKCEAMGGNAKETGTEASMCMAKANDAKNQALAAAKGGARGNQNTSTTDRAKSATGANRGDIGQEK